MSLAWDARLADSGETGGGTVLGVLVDSFSTFSPSPAPTADTYGRKNSVKPAPITGDSPGSSIADGEGDPDAMRIRD